MTRVVTTPLAPFVDRLPLPTRLPAAERDGPRTELQSPFPVVDTTAPRPTDANGVPVQCVPGLSGGEPNRHAAGLSGNTVVHLNGGLTPASYDGWPRTCSPPASPPSSTTRWTSARRSSGTTTT
jgi:hypothetical protein